MRTRRLFFAINPDAATIEKIQAVQARIEHHLPPGTGRRVPAERVHLTLLFLGKQEEWQLARLTELASRIRLTPCTLTLDHCGHFPRAGAVWLGSRGGPPQLTEFQERLAKNVASSDIEFDARPWKIHVTLYRDLRKRPETINFEPVSWHIDGYELLESMNGPNGLRYHSHGHWRA